MYLIFKKKQTKKNMYIYNLLYGLYQIVMYSIILYNIPKVVIELIRFIYVFSNTSTQKIICVHNANNIGIVFEHHKDQILCI